jgi:hypothetical protein
VHASSALPELFSAPVAVLTEGVFQTMLLTKLKIAVLGVFSAGIIVTGFGILAGQEPVSEPHGAVAQSNATPPEPGGTAKRQHDLVADEILFARGQMASLTAKEQELRAELESVRGEWKKVQAQLQEAQAKKPGEIESLRLQDANLSSDVRRQEALLDAVQTMIARYKAETTPGDVVAIAVSRTKLREMRDRLLTLRDSMSNVLRQLEWDYRELLNANVEKGAAKEQALRARIEQQRKIFNAAVEQLKDIQFLYDRADDPLGDRPAGTR